MSKIVIWPKLSFGQKKPKKDQHCLILLLFTVPGVEDMAQLWRRALFTSTSLRGAALSLHRHRHRGLSLSLSSLSPSLFIYVGHFCLFRHVPKGAIQLPPDILPLLIGFWGHVVVIWASLSIAADTVVSVRK